MFGRLQEEGWIQRKVGWGNFTGAAQSAARARATTPTEFPTRPGARSDSITAQSASASASRRIASRRHAGPPPATPRAPGKHVGDERAVVKAAVVVGWFPAVTPDWFTPTILEGLDAVAGRVSLRVELIGVHRSDRTQLHRRLEAASPDVIVGMAGLTTNVMLLRDAERMSLPVALVGTHIRQPGVAIVTENNTHCIELAMDRLRAAGHERILFLVPQLPGSWAFERMNAYRLYCEKHGLPKWMEVSEWIEPAGVRAPVNRTDADHARSVLDTLIEGPDLVRSARNLRAAIETHRPTAVLCAGGPTIIPMAALVRDGWIRPGINLSIATVDQHPFGSTWLGVESVDHVEIPLRAIGTKLALLATRLARRGRPLGEDLRIQIPCTYNPGRTVVRAASQQPLF